MKKELIKIFLFICIFFVFWNFLFKMFWLPKNNISYFYEEPNNSLDVVYIGGSNVDQYFNPLLAYDLYGFTTGLLSTSSQPFITTKYLIEESEKTQNPDLYIIDITRSQDNFVKDFSEEWTRTVSDSMLFSINRLKMINEILWYADITKNEYINYYFSFFKYHNSWKYKDDNRIYNSQNIYKGYNLCEDRTKIVPQHEMKWNSDLIDMNEENENVLLDLINYIKTKQLNVLFVVPKISYFWTPNQEQLNDAISVLESNNLEVINFNTIDFGIDYQTDFYNEYHLNVYGSTKYTLYFSKYLKEHYNLKNHIGDDNYESWETAYLNFKRDFKYLTNKDFEEFVEEYKKM